MEAGPDPKRQIEHAFLLALARKPQPGETKSMLSFLQSQGGDMPALEQLCRVILNTNEFVYPD
jgi:hypothetical protein